MMFRIFNQWLMFRALDDGRPIPAGGKRSRAPGGEREALLSVHESLRDPSGAPFEPTPPGLRERTLDAVRRSSRRARPARRIPWRLWARVGAVAAVLLILAFPFLPRPVAGPGSPPGIAPPGARAPASLSAMLDRLQPSSLRVSLDTPIQTEARQLLADARRTADLLLGQIPFLLRERREQGPTSSDG